MATGRGPLADMAHHSYALLYRGLVSDGGGGSSGDDSGDSIDDDDGGDDYDTGVTWFGLALWLVGGSSGLALCSYFLVCRRIQARSKSEDFNSKVPTAPDAPPPSTFSQHKHSQRGRGAGGQPGCGPPDAGGEGEGGVSTAGGGGGGGGLSSKNSGNRYRAETGGSSAAGGGDFRQPLMHDDEDARELFLRSTVLFDQRGCSQGGAQREANVDAAQV